MNEVSSSCVLRSVSCVTRVDVHELRVARLNSGWWTATVSGFLLYAEKCNLAAGPDPTDDPSSLALLCITASRPSPRRQLSKLLIGRVPNMTYARFCR